MMVTAGDVVLLGFIGAVNTKRRPAVVLSTHRYHSQRPDAILGLLTTQIKKATTPTDYMLQDWNAAGLHQVTAFRVYLVTSENFSLSVVGKLIERDWQGVQTCLRLALELT